MEMNEHPLLEQIRQGEGVNLEFKTCRNQLNRDVYETVCAFLNRHGGTLLLGVSDAGDIEGIEPAAVAKIKKDFVTALNNPQKIHPPAYLSVDSVVVQGKTLLNIFVPESSQVHRCNSRIYDRNEDGDFDITDHTQVVAELYHRKQATYSENKIYRFAKLEDLRSDLIDQCRRLASVGRRDHPWLKMDDLALLKSAQLYQVDPDTGEGGITLAGILLLGQDNLILSAVPHHRTDLILRKVNLDRYDDRDLVRTNLIESYEHIVAFVHKHLPDPFYLEGINRVSIRDIIFREVASNILIHREYRNAFPAKLIIERGQVRTENSCKPHGFGVLDPEKFTPYPKNPVIGAFFREIQRADELGSGMRNMMKYGKIYGGADPELIEGDVFRIVVKVPEFMADAPERNAIPQVHLQPESQPEWQPESQPESLENRLLRVLKVKPSSKSEISAQLGQKEVSGQLNKVVRELLDAKTIEYTIPDKPNSRLQKYRLTEKGLDYLRILEKEQTK